MSDLLSYQRVCGIDIAKQTLEVRILAEDTDLSFSVANEQAGFARIIELCRKHRVQIVVAEATGGLQRRLAVALVQAQLTIAIVNPSRIYHYALGEGWIAKTDKVDARTIAMFALKIAPKPTVLRTEQQEELARLAARKGQLVKAKVAEENRQQQEDNDFVLKSIDRLIRCIDREIARIDERLEKIVMADPILQLKVEEADKQIGVGRASAIGLVVAMPELGTLTGKQTSGLGGLAPLNRDSGKVIGDRHIAGGRASVRCILYMCVLSAVRYEAKLKSFYEKLLAAGKCRMKALTACMRRMLVILNARIRDALAARAAQEACA